MSILQTYFVLSTVFFIMLTVMLSSDNPIGMLLRLLAAFMSCFGIIMTLLSFGVLLSPGFKML